MRGTILVVDDSENDLLLFRRAFRGLSHPANLMTLNRAEDVLSYLAGRGKFSDRSIYPFPDLLLTDVKMPGVTGLSLLERIENLNLPVRPVIVVMSGVLDPEDVASAVKLGVASFLVKPGSFAELCALARQINGILEESMARAAVN